MKTVPIHGTSRTVSFMEDDTIETVRQLVALATNSHPDRLYIEVKTKLPADYYAENPKHWTELFFRLSYDRSVIHTDALRTYLTQIRLPTATGDCDVTREAWEAHPECLKDVYAPTSDFYEWHVLGVESPFVLPLPPRDLLELKPVSIPLPKRQSLFETIHNYEVVEFRVTEIGAEVSQLVKNAYFPYFLDTTPNNIESLRAPIVAAQEHLQKLLALNAPRHSPPSILRAKWYIPLISTRFSAPRTRFEQMFYGTTVSKETPHVGYFTARMETVRHKFYVEDPKTKTPYLDTSLVKNWYARSQPQRKLPTLLFYRGSSPASYDRIAITPKDITVTVNRDKTSTESLDNLRRELEAWLKTLDAVTPFLVGSDTESARWELGDVSLHSTYTSEVTEFDMHRFPCIQTLFGFQNDKFRLLRTDAATEDVTPLEIQAFQIINQEGVEPSAELLVKEMNLAPEAAEELYNTIRSRGEDFDYEKSIRAYPVIKFSSKEVILNFVSSIERTLEYADILRYILTSSSEEVEAVCPRRMEVVMPKAVVPQMELTEDQLDDDDDFAAALGIGSEPEPKPAAAPTTEEPKSKKVKVGDTNVGTYGYLINRIRTFDPERFEKDYPKICEMKKQVVVLTAEDRARISEEYNYSKASATEKLELEDTGAIAICPQYWCMRDEIPLAETQLIAKDDGELHCPVCDGKVRSSEKGNTQSTVEFPVLKRDAKYKRPDFLKNKKSSTGKNIPCCFSSTSKSAALTRGSDTYILSTKNVPSLRLAYIDPKLAESLQIVTDYKTTTHDGKQLKGRPDVYRVGIGRPSETLPGLLKSKIKIPKPKDAPEAVKACSFFRTWRDTHAGGDTHVERTIRSIDQAYEDGTLDVQYEIEYVCYFLKCEVIRVNTETGKVLCAFWVDRLPTGALTICMLDNDILALVTRRERANHYIVDLRVKPFVKTTLPLLRSKVALACSINLPTFSDAIRELELLGKRSYEFILDPFDRVQAIFVPREIILPITPSRTDETAPTRKGYNEVAVDELPTAAVLEAALKRTTMEGYKKEMDVYDTKGRKVEMELASGFRIPVQPEEASSPDDAREVTETLMANSEKSLVDDPPNPGDLALAESISYTSEVYAFLLFSLSKDVQKEDYADLRTSIANKSKDIYKKLKEWFKVAGYEDTTKSPVDFVNKVRTPCGQYEDKNACSKSSLCGWSKGTCRIKVKKALVDKDQLLRQIAKVLTTNDKQRSLVLDERLSPFFSTVLYLEMPHEWITTVL